MNTRIIYTNENGGTSIVTPMGKTAEELMVDYPNGEIVDISQVPSDRTFRNAWTKGNGKININMPKAKELAHSKRRADRDEKFKPLDIEATIPAKAQAAEVARQAIRDADAVKQTAINNASTPEELKVILGI